MARRDWTEADIPDQAGRTAVVTGANAGLGFEITRVLARHGARVVLACRSSDRGQEAAGRVLAESPGAAIEVVPLDLASLASVRTAAEQIRDRFPRLDLLINNAGVMDPPYQRTADGLELTFATNHLGPFALTGLVLDHLLATPGSRVVTMSSVAHRDGTMDFDDLQAEQGYKPSAAYGQSKLANLLFSYELDRRLRAAGAATAALACHPGVVSTDLFKNASGLNRMLISPRLRLVNSWFVQDVAMGARPALRAATDPDAAGGEYYGPWRRTFTGAPQAQRSSAVSYDAAAQARLWAISEELTGVSYAITAEPTLR